MQEHALPEVGSKAAEDTERVRKFILKRKGEILADLTPEPPDWPEPEEGAVAAGQNELPSTYEVHFETTWGSNSNPDPFGEGKVTYLRDDDGVQTGDALPWMGVVAGAASPQEQAMMPGAEDLASISALGLQEDRSVIGITIVMLMHLLIDGAALDIADDDIAGVIWLVPAGGSEPEFFLPFTEGTLVLSKAGTGADAPIAGSFSGLTLTVPEDPPAFEFESSAVLFDFETTWGSNNSANPFAEGAVTRLQSDDESLPVAEYAAVAGLATPEEQLILPDVEDLASISAFNLEEDGSLTGITFVLSISRLTDGATLVIGEDKIAGGICGIAPGGSEPEFFLPFGAGTLELSKAGTGPGAAIVGSFSGLMTWEPLTGSSDSGGEGPGNFGYEPGESGAGNQRGCRQG